MSSYGRAIGAADAAINLSPVACDVYDDIATKVARCAACGAPGEATHASSGQVQCSADADDGVENMRQRLVDVAIMKVPALTVVASQSRVCGCLCKVSIEQGGALVGNYFVHNSQPSVDHRTDFGMVGESRRREYQSHR
jgi:hypothetical protein